MSTNHQLISLWIFDLAHAMSIPIKYLQKEFDEINYIPHSDYCRANTICFAIPDVFDMFCKFLNLQSYPFKNKDILR